MYTVPLYCTPAHYTHSVIQRRRIRAGYRAGYRAGRYTASTNQRRPIRVVVHQSEPHRRWRRRDPRAAAGRAPRCRRGAKLSHIFETNDVCERECAFKKLKHQALSTRGRADVFNLRRLTVAEGQLHVRRSVSNTWMSLRCRDPSKPPNTQIFRSSSMPHIVCPRLGTGTMEPYVPFACHCRVSKSST